MWTVVSLAVKKVCYSMSTSVAGETAERTIWVCAGADDVITVTQCLEKLGIDPSTSRMLSERSTI